MTATSTYVENRGWEIQVLRQAPARRVIYAVAKDAVMPSIHDNIPVKDGEYQDSWDAGVSVRRSQAPNGTASAKISVGDQRWHIIEYGSVNNPPYGPIRRGVTEAGLRWYPD